MNRRSFLGGLGITAGSIAFGKAIPVDLTWLLPRDVVSHAAGATPEWLAAEGMAVLESCLDGYKVKWRGKVPFGAEAGMQQVGIDLDLPEKDLISRSLDELRMIYIEPSMRCLANEIIARNPKEAFSLPLPDSIEYKRRIRGDSGLDMRMCRAFDMSAGWEDENGVFHPRPERIITRFDVLMA